VLKDFKNDVDLRFSFRLVDTQLISAHPLVDEDANSYSQELQAEF